MNNRYFVAELEPIIREVTESGGEFELYPRGTSMLPLIVEGRDSVMLVKPAGDIARGDIVLYRRDSGKFVLHRVIRVDGDSFTMCGDNQITQETGIRREQIIAVVASLKIDGRTVSCESKKYRRFVARWLCIPYRRVMLKLYHMNTKS